MLYPPGLPPARRLARYVEVFDTVELNASFYRWPKDSTFAGWREQLPDGFTMSVKAHRGLTHYRRLASPEPWIERFERCWRLLGDRHGVLLVQLHPEQQRDDARLDSFLAVIPRVDPGGRGIAAPIVERPRGVRVAGTSPRGVCGDERCRAWRASRGPPPIWCTSGCTARIRKRSTPARIPTTTCGAGPTESPTGTATARDVWVYFNNDLGGHAVRNALALRELLR